MNQDNLDDILLSEKQIEPSPSFTHDVMARILSEPKYMRPLRFPWIRFSAATLVLAFLTIRIFPTESVIHGMNSTTSAIVNWIIALDPALELALQSTIACLAGTLILVWLSFRLTGADR